MRRALAVVLALACVGAVLATAGRSDATAPAGATFVISGHGWGHGLGMSQWGAYGYAQHGWTYDRILAHYYSGTTIGPAPVTKVRVLLASGLKKLTLSSSNGWKVADASGAKLQLAPGDLAVGPALQVNGRPLTGPLTFSGGPLSLNGKAYRGTILVSVTGKKLEAVDVVALEGYLRGVVPSEMPSSWLPEALKAQAVAARSYALANISKTGDFDLYADTRSQVYGGIAAEQAASSAAVLATAKQVVLYAGTVADTLFFSTSGGRTASSAEVLARPLPYLVSVADPYDTGSPYHDWGPVLLDAAKIGKTLKVPGQLLDLTPQIGPSGRAETVIASGTLGDVTLTGSQARDLLGLRSTWFTVGLLSLAKPAGPLAYGSAVTLTGTARGVDGVTLEQKSGSVFWQSAQPVEPGADGSFTAVAKPLATTQYRLAAGTVHAATITVPVAPVVRLDATHDTASLTGRIRPAIADAPVDIQLQSGTAWTTVASTTVDTTGAFVASLQLQPGTYRARCAPGHGLAPGLSPVLVVS